MTTDERPGLAGLTPRFAIGGLAAIGLGLLAPLLVGSFDGNQLLILAAVEAACLLVAAFTWSALVRRLEAGHKILWTLSRRDELTGVGNYRALRERLGQEISRHARRGREFALILIDLDGFKQVNEEFGHLEGDRVLAGIGAALREEVRDEDSVFRQGGDEFAVIAPEKRPRRWRRGCEPACGTAGRAACQSPHAPGSPTFPPTGAPRTS
jgi:GGDEF domain-containing protein